MKRLIAALIAGLANFAFGVVGYEFSTGGAVSWLQTGDVWRSGAIDSSMEPDEDDDRITSWLELTVDGPCTVSFAARLLPSAENGYSWPQCQMLIDGDGKSWNPQPGSGTKQSVDVCGGGSHVIRWEVYTYGNWGEGQRSPIEISNVQIQDAPASVTLRFDANGGSVGVSERTFSTSAANYGDLPVPTRGGCEFLGWFTAKLGGDRVDEGSGVRFNATVLYAQWSIPLKQAVGAGVGVDISDYGDGEPWDEWHGVLDESHDGMGAAFGGKNAGALEIQTIGKGTLSFWWKAKGGGNGYVQDIDWHELARIESRPKWSSVAQKNIFLDSDWQQVEIPIVRDDEVQHWIQSNYYVESGDDCGVLIDEIRWTPAPAEVTVSFDANGGQTDARSMTFDTYEPYSTLPTAERAGWNFDGWFTAPVGGRCAYVGGEVLFYATTLYAHWSIPLNEALGTDLEIWSDQLPNSDDFGWYGNPEIKTPFGRGAACNRRDGKTSGFNLYAAVEGMGTISFWWKTKGDAYGYFTAGPNKDENASISAGIGVFNSETGAIEYQDSEWKQVSIDCRSSDEVHWYGYLYDEPAELQVCGLTWTPAPGSMEVKYMIGKDVVGKTKTYSPGAWFWGASCCNTGPEPYEPTRAGYVFGGWFYDKEFGRQVQGADHVPFAGATVYAKWYRTLASAETSLTFVNSPDAAQDADLYRQIGYAPTDWELVERTYDTGTDEMAVQLGEVTDDTWNMPETWAVLETTVTGSAFLDFVWRMSYGNGGFGSLVLTVDGKEVADLDTDWNAVESGASPEQTVRVVIGEGEHTVRWEATGSGGANAKVRDVSTSEITPAATLGEWMTRWRKLWCWTPDNLSALIAKSAAEKASGTTTARYKAAIEHALATILSLGEDKLVIDTLGQFGYDFDFLHCKALGSFRYDKAPVLNKLADEAVGKMKTAVETALVDLDAIPSTWTGAIPVSAAEYPVDADIVIDLGDVLYLKSLLKAALGAAQWVKAYDVEVDWEKLEADSRAESIEVVADEPKLGLDDNWGKVRPFTSASLDWQKFEDDFWLLVDEQQSRGNVESSGDFQVAWHSDRLYLRVKKSKFFVAGKPSVLIDFGNGLMSGHVGRRLEIFYWDAGAEFVDPKTGEKKTIYWYVAGNAVEDLPDIPAVDFQENESEFVLSVDLSGTEIAKNAELRRLELLEVSTFGASEADGGSERTDGVQRYLVRDAKAGLAAVGQTGVCGKVRNATALEQSKSLVLEALKLAQSADAFIMTKRTRSDVCLFNYDDCDEALVAAMREHVATAIASMDSVQSFDWQKGLSEERQEHLLRLDSPIDIYLGALFSGRVTCGVIPPSAREDAYVADLGRMSSPTLAGLMPGMTCEKWAELAEAEGVAYRYEMQTVPEYGPWGEADAVKNPDKLAPTMLTDMTLTINGLQAALGDVVAAFRADTGALCGLGKVMDGSGTLTMACYAPTGVKLHFQVWLSDSGLVSPNVLDCVAKSDLTVSASGAFLSGHALVVSDSKDLTISLKSADWHTVSFNVRPDDPSPAAVFADVKSKVAAVTQGVEFWMPGKTSSLKAVEIGKGYWVNTKSDNVVWTVSGKTDPSVEIALEEGWNLVGYVPEAAGAVQQVLKTAFAAKAIDYVACGIELYPGGTLKTMEPGKAYWVHANGPYVLKYDEPKALMKATAKGASTPMFGPWGESDAVKNPDKLMPTVLENVAVFVDGEPAAPGDVVAAFRADTGALCGLGKVLDDSGSLMFGCLAPKEVVLSFKVWLSESGMEKPVIARCDDDSKLVAPESGAIFGGHEVSASTAVRVETIIVGDKVEIDTEWPGCAVSGLPAGLTYNKTTGKITGAAKAVTAEEGVVVRFAQSGAETEEMTIVVRKEEMSVGCTWLSEGVFTAGVDAGAGGGIRLDDFMKTESGIKSIAVKKLPTGMSYNATKRIITGFPSKAGTYPVEITVTSVAGAVAKTTVYVTVEALPAWAVGNFAGTVTCADGTHGTASFTVSAAGAISSGKLLEHGSNWTFTAKSFAADSVARGLEQDYIILADAKCGKSTRAIELHVMGCAAEGIAENAALVEGLFGDDELELWRNVWKDTDAKGYVAGIAGKYTYFFEDGTVLPLDLKTTAALSGKANIRARDKASVNFSTTVFASSNGVEAAFYVAPDAKKGYEEIYERFVLVPESGEREPGVAHRAPGVVAVPEHYPSDEGYGTVSVSPAGGQVDAGKTVTVTAKPDSKSVFVKWRYEIGGEIKYSELSKLTLTMDGEHDVFASAIFRSKGSFKEPVVTVETSEQAKFAALELGVKFSAFVTVTEAEDMKPVKWSAANLPSGLKINAETGEISGVATAVNSRSVTITATSVADPKKKTTFTLDLGGASGMPAALPETAVGTFTGFVDNGNGDHAGTFTFTSSEKGSLSAKVIEASGTVSFSGSGFAWSKDGRYGVSLKTTKGEELTLTLNSAAGWDAQQLVGGYSAANGRALEVSAQRNAFSKSWYFTATGNEKSGWTFAFTTDAKAAAFTVTLKADGTVSAAGKLPNGVDKNGKAVTLSVSASSVANVGMMRNGAIIADFAPVLTVNKVKKVLAVKVDLWFDRSNEHIGKEGVGEAVFVE